ncbi:MAG: NAD-dependent epimerase/dehydratase family protein [Clostridia bacterium]|nr:NAD-dependent epimerase/dehydratase family protein [Clostridia bacterium]
MNKVLVLGATGAMGKYLVPYLLEMGYAVDAVAMDKFALGHKNLRAFAMSLPEDNDDAIEELLKNEYSAIVDFLIYHKTENFSRRIDKFLNNTDHYIYLSSYRTYANEEHPIKETSPLLLDVLSPEEIAKNPGDYSLYKAEGERVLRALGKKNWSIIRPAITYSVGRYQLVTCEANVVYTRAMAGKAVLLPEEAMGVQATMSWAGDIARMIARMILNPAAYGETYTVSTAEHNEWKTVAEYYGKLIGMKYQTIPTEDFIGIMANPARENGLIGARWQLCYDRLFDRIIDNSKILNVTGMKQSELMPLYDGLKLVLSELPRDHVFAPTTQNDRMDEYIKAKGIN